MNNVAAPNAAAPTLLMPFQFRYSSTRQRATAPQPMNTAEEYKFVTGGRS